MQNSENISPKEQLILNILWKNGESNIREVHDQLEEKTGWAYSTTKTRMDRMAKKGLLERFDSHGVWLYKPVISRTEGLAHWVKFVADGIFETDYSNVVNMFSENIDLSQQEKSDLIKILEEEE